MECDHRLEERGHYCGHCGNDLDPKSSFFDDEHIWYCEECGTYFCDNCAEDCPICGEVCCPHCKPDEEDEDE